MQGLQMFFKWYNLREISYNMGCKENNMDIIL